MISNATDLRDHEWLDARADHPIKRPAEVHEDLRVLASEEGIAFHTAQRETAATLGAADWLSLAAAPTFAFMALLTGFLDGGAPDMLCSSVHGASPLTGMVQMYVLMSAFHSASWLKLISRLRSGRD